MRLDSIMLVFAGTVGGVLAGAQGGDTIGKNFGPEGSVRGVIAGCLLGGVGGFCGSLGLIVRENRKSSQHPPPFGSFNRATRRRKKKGKNK